MPLPFENHADYDLVTINDQFVYIKDSGHNQFKTVTNDVQFVLSSLQTDYNLKNQRVFYRDSQGTIDEIGHNAGIFQSFKPGYAPFSLAELEGRVMVTKREIAKKKSREYELER